MTNPLSPAGPAVIGPSFVPNPDVVVWDDFTIPGAAQRWTLTDANGTAVLAEVAAHGGQVSVTTGATDGDDGFLIGAECIALATGRDVWFAARVKIEDVDQDEFFVGLHDSAADIIAIATHDGIGFKSDGDGNLDIVVGNGTNQTVTDTGIDLADDTWFELSFHCIGGNKIEFYHDQVRVGSISKTPNDYHPTDVLAVVAGIETNDAGSDAITIDYIGAAAEITR